MTGKESITGSFGYITSLFKVVDSKDGCCYTLRRVERVRTNNEMVVCDDDDDDDDDE